MGKELEPWRNLAIGDQVRIVRMPSEIDDSEYVFHEDTRELYSLLIDRSQPLTIRSIDERGNPWINCRVKQADGRWVYHSLAICDDSWVRVNHRNKAP